MGVGKGYLCAMVLVVFISWDDGMGIFIYRSHGIGAFHDFWDGHFLITVLVG